MIESPRTNSPFVLFDVVSHFHLTFYSTCFFCISVGMFDGAVVVLLSFLVCCFCSLNAFSRYFLPFGSSCLGFLLPLFRLFSLGTLDGFQ